MDSIEKNHLTQLTKGNKASFIWIHQKYQSKIYHYALKFVRNKEVAEEITSDVFVKLWAKRADLFLDISVDRLLYKITRDYCLSHLRKIAKDKTLRESFINHYFADLSNKIEDEISFKEGLAVAQAAIESLPPKCRAVFQLRYFNDLSLRQIAEELNISPNTVQNHLTKGTRLVKMHLKTNSDLVFVFILLFQ